MHDIGVPVEKQFRYAYTYHLDTAARTALFPQLLRSCSNLSAAVDGVKTYDDFGSAVLSSHLGDRKQLDLQIFYSLLAVKEDISKAETMQTLAKVEAGFARMRYQLCGLTKIVLVHHAIHPKLKGSVAFQPDGKEWDTYADFR
jgi:hypothetical protein